MAGLTILRSKPSSHAAMSCNNFLLMHHVDAAWITIVAILFANLENLRARGIDLLQKNLEEDQNALSAEARRALIAVVSLPFGSIHDPRTCKASTGCTARGGSREMKE